MTAIKRVESDPRKATKSRNVKSGLSLAIDHRSRTKDYLDAAAIDLLLKAAKAGRYGTRDSLLLMVLYATVSALVKLSRFGSLTSICNKRDFG